ncbi:MAG TPA: YIP1 family protein [Methanoregulaceae archaeon]|nr:YIP1 family protein [Methanoregulaceae archaeon]
MTLSFIEKIKGFLFNPRESFQKVRAEEPGETIKYFMIIAVFYSIMATIMTVANVFTHPFIGTPQDPLLEPLLILSWAFVILVFTLISAVIFGFWLHLWVYIVGGRKGIWPTEKSVFYNLTPMMMIGWIPVIGAIVGAFWSIIIGIIGIRELHEISDTRAAIAVIVAVLLGGIIIFVILFAFLLAVIASAPIAF